MVWIGWDRLCRGKMEGRIGFKDLKAFNLAMLGKQCWRLMIQQDWGRAEIPFWQWWLERASEMKNEANGPEIMSKLAFVLWRLCLARNDKAF